MVPIYTRNPMNILHTWYDVLLTEPEELRKKNAKMKKF